MLFFGDKLVDAVDNGVAWIFGGTKRTVKKISSKSIRHKAKLAKRKAKRGRHYKRYWGCTKEAKYNARRDAIAANSHGEYMYWRRKAYEEENYVVLDPLYEVDEAEDEAFWEAMPAYQDDFSFMPGLVPKRTCCSCKGCMRDNQTVLVSNQDQVTYAKAPVSVVAPTCTKSFFNMHVLLLLIGIAFGMLCVPAVAMDLGDGSKFDW